MRQRSLAYLLLVSSLSLAGCGLSEYEQRMDKDRKRWQQFDEANKALGAPLEMPTEQVWQVNPETKKKEKVEKPAFEPFFLRPPKGIAVTVKDKDGLVHVGRVALACYAGEDGMNLYFAMSSDEQLQDEKKTLKEHNFRALFQADVRAAFGKMTRRALASPEAKLKELSLPPLGIHNDKRPELEFQHLSADDARYAPYFHRAGDLQVAIIYELPQRLAQTASGKQLIEFSLRSLGLGADVARNRRAYDQWKAQ